MSSYKMPGQSGSAQPIDVIDILGQIQKKVHGVHLMLWREASPCLLAHFQVNCPASSLADQRTLKIPRAGE